ncbi:hypothetical protein K493DRAFT_25220 [Basidiobolus meristosporus CBS 931.73]|uniref:Uncharacterized protein n=1 Tax=Basidiobolus meristosporus CBS 931.73 TaxID=1314790 RepID=A0A1Y1YBK2_9FUNG|nr:hypothetical protein K493DRAFT_25220 [Basidiobolus meristosporus CBS 931.73]|eukprot:ORX95367.1 hypothetical protein K493DRAFT_25220 [Basidiobolus meristosporus CBS 931.73]
MLSTQTPTYPSRNLFSTGCSPYSPHEYSNLDLSAVVSHSPLKFKRKRSHFVEIPPKHPSRPVKRPRTSQVDTKTSISPPPPTEQELLHSTLATFRFSQGVRIFDLSSGETLKEVGENYATSKASRKAKSHNPMKDTESKKTPANGVTTTSHSKDNYSFSTPSPPSCKSFGEMEPPPSLVDNTSPRIYSMEID